MRSVLVVVWLLVGGLQALQASEYRTAGEPLAVAAHSCCPDAGAHASCCPDACASLAAIASSPAISLWCGRMNRLALLQAKTFVSRGESPLTRPPIRR